MELRKRKQVSYNFNFVDESNESSDYSSDVEDTFQGFVRSGRPRNRRRCADAHSDEEGDMDEIEGYEEERTILHKLSVEIWHHIFDMVGPNPHQLAELAKVCRLFRGVTRSHLAWKRIAESTEMKIKSNDYYETVIKNIKYICTECGRKGLKTEFDLCSSGPFPVRLCRATCLKSVWQKYCIEVLGPIEGRYLAATPGERAEMDNQLTKGYAIAQYNLPDYALNWLPYEKKKNPHHAHAAPMRLYKVRYLKAMRDFFYGSEEGQAASLENKQTSKAQVAEQAQRRREIRRQKLADRLKELNPDIEFYENNEATVKKYIRGGAGKFEGAVEAYMAYWQQRLADEAEYRKRDDRRYEVEQGLRDEHLFDLYCAYGRFEPFSLYIESNIGSYEEGLNLFRNLVERKEFIEEEIAKYPFVNLELGFKDPFFKEYLDNGLYWERIVLFLKTMDGRAESRKEREDSLKNFLLTSGRILLLPGLQKLEKWKRFVDHGLDNFYQVIDSVYKHEHPSKSVERNELLDNRIPQDTLNLKAFRGLCSDYAYCNKRNITDLVDIIAEKKWLLVHTNYDGSEDNDYKNIRTYEDARLSAIEGYVSSHFRNKTFKLPRSMLCEQSDIPPRSLWPFIYSYFVKNLFEEWSFILRSEENVEIVKSWGVESLAGAIDVTSGPGTSDSIKHLLKIETFSGLGANSWDIINNVIHVLHATIGPKRSRP